MTQTDNNSNQRPDSRRLLNVKQVAERLNVSKSFAYQLLASGEIAVVRIGNAIRVKQEDLDNYIELKTYLP